MKNFIENVKKFFMPFTNKIKSIFTPKSTKSSVAWLAVALSAILVFSLFANIAQTDWGRTTIVDQYAAIEGLGGNMSVRLYKPSAASKETPVPLVIATHGYLNNKEMVDMTAVELSRRGYAVVTVDAEVMGVHGESENFEGALAGGLVQAIEHFSALPWIDSTRIGVTGHSMGGAATNNTVKEYATREKTAFVALQTKYAANGVVGTTSKDIYNSLVTYTASLSGDAKLAVEAEIKDAKSKNKIAAALDMANNPLTDSKSIGLDTSYGVLFGEYDEFFFKQVGAQVVHNNIVAQKKILSGNNAFNQTYETQTKYEWNVRDYLTSPTAASFIQTIYPELATTVRKTLPKADEYGYSEKAHGELWKELDAWNLANAETHPESVVTAPTTTVIVPNEGVSNWGVYTAAGLQSKEYGYNQPVGEPFRAIYMQNEIHPWNHFSTASSAASSTFFMSSFGQAYEGAIGYAPYNQNWWVKEMFNFFAMIGFLLMVVPVVQLLMKLPVFAATKREVSEPTMSLKTPLDWIMYIVPALILSLISGFAIVFFTNENGSIFNSAISGNTWFPQTTTGYVGNWAFWNGLIGLAMMTLIYWVYNRRKGVRLEHMGVKTDIGSVVKMLGLAIITVTASYLMLGVVDFLFDVDFRLWTFAAKPFASYKLPTAINYMFIFVIYYIYNAIATSSASFKNIPSWITTTLSCVFSVLGILIVLAIQYGTTFATGALQLAGMNLIYIVLFPIVPVLIFATIISKKLYKETGSIWLPAFVNTILFTIITVSGTVATAPWFQLFGL